MCVRVVGSLVFVCALSLACSGSGGGDDDDGGGGGGKSSKAGTGLASGTVCIALGTAAELCTPSGNVASRTVANGEIDIHLSHRVGTFCPPPPYPRDDFGLSFTIPDGLPFPYTATQSPAISSFNFSNGDCFWDDGAPGGNPAISGTVYQAGTNGATHLEGDITLQTDGVRCGATGCPMVVPVRVRYNVPL